MEKVERFDDLIAWQKARLLTAEETSRIIGGLKASVQKQRDNKE